VLDRMWDEAKAAEEEEAGGGEGQR
jgi:hypothetical protein